MFITDKEVLKCYADSKRVWQGVSGIERTEKGRLFSTYFSGMSGEATGNFCIISISDDD